jgi:rhodanese-related sulfurtransferase
MRALVREQGALLLDVRSTAEFGGGHMDGAVNLPVDQVSRIASVEPDHERPIVVYCRSGARSARAAQVLRQSGYSNVHDLGPMQRW